MKISLLPILMLLLSCAPPRADVKEANGAGCNKRANDGVGCVSMDFYVDGNDEIKVESPESKGLTGPSDQDTKDEGLDGQPSLADVLRGADPTLGAIPSDGKESDKSSKDGEKGDEDSDGESGSGSGGGKGSSVANGGSGSNNGFGDAIAKGLKGLTNSILKGLDDVFGFSKKKAKEKRQEIDQKIAEGQSVAEKIGNLADSARKNYDEDVGLIKAMQGPEFFNPKDIRQLVQSQGRSHNEAVRNTSDKDPDLKLDAPKVEELLGNERADCEESNSCSQPNHESEKVENVRGMIEGARSYVKEHFTGKDQSQRERLLDSADAVTGSAVEFYKNGDIELGDTATELALKMADMAIGATPIVGDLVDIASAIAGENIITGEPLDDGERIVQAAMAVSSLATGGTVGVIKDVVKGANVIKGAIKEEVKKEVKERLKKEVGKEVKKEAEHQIEKETRRRTEPVDGAIEDHNAARRGERTPGLVSPDGPPVEMGKQGKHIEGHNNFQENKGILTADPKELAKKAGTGTSANGKPAGEPGAKERVVFDKQIGQYYDRVTDTYENTNTGMIHYSKQGIHIVPARNQE